VQVTAASLGGRLGSRARVTGLELFRLGLAHVLASDAHMPAVRGVGMTAAVNAIKDKALARWLTEDAPTAILADEAVPPRPVARRRWLR
jgi:tyrosine-protein phosphatase YwqE